MSDNEVQSLLPTAHSPSPTISEKSEQDPHSPLYRSLESCLSQPDVVSPKWMDTLGDLANNPRKLSTAPYNDGSLHWMNTDDNVLSMAFPAVLRTSGKYARIGPYFNLKGEQDVKVSFALYPTGKVEMIPSWSLAQGNTVGLLCGLGTRYRIYLHMSRDLEVTPPCSIRPLPFGDILVVRTRKLTNEKMKKNGQKTGVSEHNANKENKTKVKKMR